MKSIIRIAPILVLAGSLVGCAESMAGLGPFMQGFNGQPPVALSREVCVQALGGDRASGLNRICYYQCASGLVALTIDVVALCPLSIER